MPTKIRRRWSTPPADAHAAPTAPTPSPTHPRLILKNYIFIISLQIINVHTKYTYILFFYYVCNNTVMVALRDVGGEELSMLMRRGRRRQELGAAARGLSSHTR